MGCVNTSSKKFRELAAKNNVDINALELITHKYWLEKGTEEFFPTDVYIQAQLGNTQYKEPNKSVRKLWETEYNLAKEFSSLTELQAAENEASKFFPKSALVHYKDAKGTYVLRVKQPVARILQSKSDALRDGFLSNVGHLQLGLQDNVTYDINKVQELFYRFNDSRTNKYLADKVFEVAKQLGLDIKFNTSITNPGRYTNDNSITYNKPFFERDWMNNKKSAILLHEVIHSVTMYALSDQMRDVEKPEALTKFATEINSVFQDVRNNPALQGERGIVDVQEFVAELANPIFRKKLQSIDKRSFWDKILNAIKTFFGIKSGTSYYNRAMKALEDALEAFDIDTYNKYTNVDNTLQKAYEGESVNFRGLSEKELKDNVKEHYLSVVPLETSLDARTKERLKQAKKAADAEAKVFDFPGNNDDTTEERDKATSDRVESFRKDFGDLVRYFLPLESRNGGTSFKAVLKSTGEILNDRNASTLEYFSMVDNMSRDELLSSLLLMEQESADYDFVTGGEQKTQGKSEHTGPQPFTFDDGVTVNAPFTPNAQQASALNEMNDFIHSDETSMTLSGYAGTGKTSIMEMLATKMRKERRNIVFSATTNKAAAVLNSRVSKSGFKAYTLNKVFGISVEVDSNKAYDAKNLVNVLKDSDLVSRGDVVVIDEASMINEENYNTLNQVAGELGLKIIYVGDKAQLAPVNEEKVSKVFRNGDGKVIELTQVERTDDNAILKEATAIRNGKRLSGESSFNEKGEGVAYIPKTNKRAIGDVVRYFVPGLKENPNYFRILAYTNDAVSRYNTAVRKTLGYEGHIPQVGEPMTGYANWGYDYRTKSYKFINSESYKVTRVEKEKPISIRIETGVVTLQSTPITLEDSMGNTDTFDFIDIIGNPENQKGAITLAKEKARLWEKYRKAPGREGKAEVLKKINDIDSFLFVNDNIVEGNRTLQSKTIDFGYALTIHKSQGSTFTNVLMDDVDVQKASTSSNNISPTVDLGETAWQDPSSAQQVGSTDVDLGVDFEGMDTASPTDNIANVRQQLEYVGVSRATDTVTIISNDVKKEDTPLNHIPEAKQDAAKQSDEQTVVIDVQTPLSYEGTITPDENTIFVFGSNPEGRHGAGAAKTAREQFGAIYGQGEGLQGNAYALPTKDLRVKENKGLRSISPEQITENIKKMYEVAEQNPDKLFKVAYTHGLNETSLNGYTGAEMIKMFKDAGPIPSNVVFSKNWIDHWDEVQSEQTETTTPVSQEEIVEEEQVAETPQEKKVKRNLSEFDKLMQQFDNLLDSDSITASEIRHVAELVVNSMSDIITLCQTEKGFAKKRFPDLNSSIDFQNATRKQIVETLGVNRLVYLTKDLFKPENANYEDIETMMQAQLIVDNWDAIMTLASDVFALNEGFGITKNYDKGGFKVADNADIEYENFNEAQDTESVEENYGDEQEHWQIESRTIDVLNSMSQLVRLALHDCYQLDKNGNQIMSKWGIAERVNSRRAVNSILKWTQGAQSLDDMVSRIQERQERNPWVSQLLTRLSDKSGKETDFQSQFYGVFQKSFQRYTIVLLEDGKYTSIPVNDRPALKEAMNSIITQFKVGEHPLFTSAGINSKLLGSDQTTGEKDEMNLHKALVNLQTIQESLSRGEQLDTEMAKEASANISSAFKILGYPVTEELLQEAINQESISKMTNALQFIVKSLDSALKEQRRNEGTPNAKSYNPFAYNVDNSIGGAMRNFLSPITDILEDTAINAFYDSGKMYQSYVTPSFWTKLMSKFRLQGEQFDDFILNEYANSEWYNFNGDINTGWRNEWLRQLARDPEARKVFDHKVELNFNKHNYMRNMSDAEYTLSLITEYLSETGGNNKNLVPAWFRVPMQSNKPSSEFIKFYSYRGETYKDQIIDGLYEMFCQELSRIQTVRMRNHSKGDAEFITNFDSNGRRFNFLPVLNDYIDGKSGNLLRNEDGTVSDENKRLANLLQKKINGMQELTSEEETSLQTLIQKALRNHMEERTQEILSNWEKNGILEAAKNIKNVGNEEAIRETLENFIWNDNFAAKNILQLTVGDIAFYKDAEDLQKRLAQLHAPGIRGNIHATDYEGNAVSDGKYRTVLLKDFDAFISNVIDNISEVFDKKITNAPEDQKATWRALKENLVGKEGKFRKINVVDGQGYSSPSSYRKKAFIFGKWSRQAEDIYQKLIRGDYNYSDLETAFQPLKPFVYTRLQKNMGVENAPIQTVHVPFQAKNSEYLLIMADAMLKGEELSRPNLLRAVYRVMEDSEKINPTKGIDTIQFESAVKSGKQAPIDINQFLTTPGGEEGAYTYMMGLIYKRGADGTRTNEYETDTFVQEASYDDYCLQQEVPAHFRNHAQAHGSQIRMITPSDLDLYKDPKGDLTDENNKIYYEWTEPDGTHKKVTADEYRKEYEENIATNIEQSINDLAEELHINSQSKKERNIALSKILQREILSSPRYGVDLVQACTVDSNTGDFRIPKGDPIQAKRIEQLINSIIKNRVNKQEIAGGPVVQVSNYGTSKQLHIRFNSKQGGLLMTREEYEKNPQKKELTQVDKFKAKYKRQSATNGTMSYEEYVKENQAGIAYFEVFAPIWSKELFDKFGNPDGSINVAAIEATDPELLKMISYRIPTEDKYSCAPIKIVGFMPREAGEAIMFPYELTEIDDSDFDIDKRYIMRKEIPILTKEAKEIKKQLKDVALDSYLKAHPFKAPNDVTESERYSKESTIAFMEKEHKAKADKYITEQVNIFMSNPQKMRQSDPLMRWLNSIYQTIAYYTEPPRLGRLYRDNKIVDMTWAVLTNEMTADKILNPGGFDPIKKAAYSIDAFKNSDISWDELQKMSVDELKEVSATTKDLTWVDTQVHFYKQNAAGSNLIGVFAVNKVAHATLESNDILIAVNELCGDDSFTIASMTFGGRMYIDPKYDIEGNLIGKTVGSGVSASADTAKEPTLDLLNVNMTTAGIFNTMLRLGMPLQDAALFLGQDVITKTLAEFNRKNLTDYEPLSNIIQNRLSEIREEYNINENSNINKEPLTKEELIDGLKDDEHDIVIDYKVLLAFQKLKALADAMRNPTFATRFNSISSAVGPLIIDNLILEHKIYNFSEATQKDGTNFYNSNGDTVDISTIFDAHPILKQFARTVDIANAMFRDMPAGSTGFRNLLNHLPSDISDKMYNDKSLLDKFSNFYQSYLLLASKFIDSKQLANYVNGFAAWFMSQNFKEKYPNNELIQAIKQNVNKKTGRPYLTINTTGADTQYKESLGNAWVDLHKVDPVLSQRLFVYCFFRAGVGFSPKTFMSLVPTYVKERLTKTLSDGTITGYVDTYRVFPSVNEDLVIEQFIRNNWNNNKLVPNKGNKDSKYFVDLNKGILKVTDEKEIKDLEDVSYMKHKFNGQTHLWKQVGSDASGITFEKLEPLGNNSEYLEMSLEEIKKPLTKTTQVIEDVDTSDISETSPMETNAAEKTKSQISNTEQSKNVAEIADLIQEQRKSIGKPVNKTEATNMAEEIKKNPSKYADYLINVFKQKGLTLDKQSAINEFKKYC